MSLSRPASHCPSCGTPIRWHDNVPIFGWLWLRGRCRDCKTPISPRYPAVELLVALIGAALWLHVVADGRLTDDGLRIALMEFLLLFYFAAAMVVAAFIDLDLTIIPHRVTLPTMAWGLLAGAIGAKTGVWDALFPPVDLIDSLLGLVAGGGVLFIVFKGYSLLRGIDGGGGGDITLLAAIGANLGWQSLVFVLMAASVQGLIAALASALLERRRGEAGSASGGLLLRGAHTEEFWEEHPVLGRRVLDGETLHSAEPGSTEPAAVRDAGDRAEVDGEPPARPTAADATSPVPEAAREEEPFLRLAIPFGPFLALAALEYVFFGEAAMRWFTSGMYP